MSFQILDNDESFDDNQSIWMQSDIDALVAGYAATGVLAGCAVTAQGTPDMTVAVAAGEIVSSGAKALVTAGNVTISTAHATNPRIDLVTASSTGTKTHTAGTAAASPKAPDIPANHVLLAMVYVPAADTAIAANQITDKRVLIRPPFAESAAFPSGGAKWWNMPGITTHSVATRGLIANRMNYEPMLVVAPTAIDALGVEVSTLIAATNIRLGIYHADEDWQPTTLVVDAGAVASDTTGVKTASFTAMTLQPGRYVKARISNGAPTIRVVRGALNLLGYFATLGATPSAEMAYVGSTYGALPTSGVLWTTTTAGNIGFENGVFVRITDASP